ncbi:MAG: metallophosphoesterase family protein [bacterium]|nr:metallophosphoesterase family protein [bacterium]
MRLAVIADIHGNWTALETVLSDLERSGGWDHLWVLGDLAAFGPRPAACIHAVQSMIDAAEAAGKKGTVRAVRGNTDRYLVTGARPRSKPAEDAEGLDKLRTGITARESVLAWGLAQLEYPAYETLKNLSGECDLFVPGYGYVIGYHGTPGDDEGAHITPETPDEEAADALLEREGRLGIGAHIHVQMDRALPGGWRVVNVGSVGMSFDKPGYAQYGIFTFDEAQLTVDLRAIPYDVDAAIDDLRAVGYPNIESAAEKYRRGQG